MASLVTSVAGQWTGSVTFPSGSPTDLGINRDGWKLATKFHWQVLSKTDKFGSSGIEGWYQGLDMFLAATFEEWRASEVKFQTLFADTLAVTGVNVFNHGLVGSLATDSAAAFAITSVASTPARANSFTSITFHAVTADEGFGWDWNFGPDKLVMPFRGRVWPVVDGSSSKYFTTA